MRSNPAFSSEYDFKNDKSNDTQITKIVNYFDNTYIKNNETFPPSVWAKKISDIRENDSNDFEYFHATTGKLFTSTQCRCNFH